MIKQALRNISQRATLMIGRAVVSAINDNTKLQTINVTLLAGESRVDIERVQNYGFSSVPVAGSEAVIVFVGGCREHGLAVAVDDRNSRPTGLEDGDVCIYDNRGNKITLTADGIVIDCIDTVTINGDVETFGTLKNNGVNVGSTHV